MKELAVVPRGASDSRDAPRGTTRALGTIAIVAVLALSLGIAWLALDLVLTFFAGVLAAVFLRGVANLVHRFVGVPEGSSLLVGGLALLMFATIATRLLSHSVVAQVDDLSANLPLAVTRLRGQVESQPWGQWLLTNMPDPDLLLPQQKGIMSMTTSALSGTLGILATAAVVLFLGIYLAATPEVYRDGALRLVPRARRARAAQVMDEMAHALRWWLVGKLIAMSVIGVATTLGLLALGIAAPIALGLIAAVLTFVPNFGPFLAATPAILLGLLSGPMVALWVAFLYLSIQMVESYVVTPLVQERTVSLPPGLTIGAQVVLGVAAGLLGLALATPLVAAGLVATKRLYVEDALDDHGVGGEQPPLANSGPASSVVG